MEGMVEAVTLNGKTYAVPLMASWTIMFYNAEMFQKAGARSKQAAFDLGRSFLTYGKKLQSADDMHILIPLDQANMSPLHSSAGPNRLVQR